MTLVLFVICLCFVGTSPAPPPNILFILADDFGWNDVGYHGSEIHTPTLDRLSAQGVRLENYYVQPICTPTRSQLLSGRYQIHTGLQHSIIWADQPNGLPLTDPTIADRLKLSGYSTHIVGKWHIGFYKKEYTPTYRGFDSFFGYFTSREDYYNHTNCGFCRGHPFCGVDLHANDHVQRNYSGIYSTPLFASKAMDIVDKHDTNKPLFLYLPFQSVHEPLQVPQKYIDMYSNIKDINRRTYAGMVTCMDDAVSDVVKAFEKKGLWDNTILIFSTDNGGQVHKGGNNWPLRGWKGSLWEGGMRGVGFVTSPLLEKPGRVVNDLVHVSDWFPTLLHAAGGSTAGLKLDGYNVWESISKGAASARNELLHNIDPLYNRIGKPTSKIFDNSVRAAIRVGDWKLITGNPGNGSWIPPPDGTLRWNQFEQLDDKKNMWLFNIKSDPQEKNEVSSLYPSVVQHLLDRLAAYNATAVPVRYPPADPQSNPALHGGAWVPWKE